MKKEKDFSFILNYLFITIIININGSLCPRTYKSVDCEPHENMCMPISTLKRAGVDHAYQVPWKLSVAAHVLARPILILQRMKYTL